MKSTAVAAAALASNQRAAAATRIATKANAAEEQRLTDHGAGLGEPFNTLLAG